MPYSYNPMLGVSDYKGVGYITANRNPTADDYNGIEIPTVWVNMATHTPFILVSKSGGTATWNQLSASTFYYYKAVLSIADCTAPPPTALVGDRYIIDNTAGVINAAWGVGAAKNDVAEYDATIGWFYFTPAEGGLVYVVDVTDLYFFDGTDWKNLGLAVPVMTNVAVGTGEIATDAEAIAGTLTDYHVINPGSLKAKLGTQTVHGVIVGAGTTTALTALTVGASGQVLVGSVGADPVFGTITSGNTSITFTPGAGTLAMAVTQAGEAQLGGAEIATGAETTTATLDNVIVTPSKLNTRLGTQTIHGVMLGTGGAGFNLSATSAGTASQLLMSKGAAADPAWTTSTYPDTVTQGDLVYASAANTVSLLAKDATATRYLSNTGVTNNPAWAQVALGTGVSGTLPMGNGGLGVTSVTQFNMLIGDAGNAIDEITNGTNGQVLLAATGAAPLWATLTSTGTITFAPLANALALNCRAASSTDTGVIEIATNNETKTGTSTSLAVTPDDLSAYMTDQLFTGFVSWAGAGNYYSLPGGTAFTLLRSGDCYVRGKKVPFADTQTIAAMSAGSTHYVYIDNAGVIGHTTTRSDALYTNQCVLFEVLVDNDTPVNIFVVKDNTLSSFSPTVSNYLFHTMSGVLDNTSNGANIAVNGTKGIQINTADSLLNRGLTTVVPDSAAVAVTINYMFTDATSKWVLQVAQNTVPSIYNNAGTPTALSAGKYGVFVVYVAKDDLNAATPQYFAVVDDAQYDSSAAAQTAINAGSVAVAGGALLALEVCQLGYVIFAQATDSITSAIISKWTLRNNVEGNAVSVDASEINTNTANFDGILSAADTTVQIALEQLDEFGKNLTDKCVVVGNGNGNALGVIAAGTNGQILTGVTANDPAWTTATYPAATTVNQLLYSGTANIVSGLTTGNSGLLVTSGTGVPSIATDIPTAVTIGTAYVYRVGGTDISLADGGTNASLAASNGGIFYSTATAGAILAGTATANQILMSGLSTTPAWSTATYPATTTANQLLYSSGASVVTGLATGNSGVLVTSALGVPSIGTDIPTAVTIGTAYIYRAGGTDVAIIDGGTNSSAALANGKMMVSSGGGIIEGTPTVVAGAIGAVTTLSMSGQLTSTLAIGTAPFAITSTTKVTNLNVDQVDGYHFDQALLQASSPTFVTVYGTTFDTNVAAAAVTLAGTTLAADGTDVDININVTPKGAGSVVIAKVDINGGAIDGTPIGVASASTGAFTAASATTSFAAPLFTNGAANFALNMGDDIGGTQLNFTNASDATVAYVNSLGKASFTELVVDNINVNLNTISTTTGNLNITPVAGSNITFDGNWTIDGTNMGVPSVGTITPVNVMTIVSNNAGTYNTSKGLSIGLAPGAGATADHLSFNWDGTNHVADINAYSGANYAASYRPINMCCNGGSINMGTKRTTADTSKFRVTGANITSLGNIDIQSSGITGTTAANTTITAYAGNAIAIEGVTFDGGVVAGATTITASGDISTTAGHLKITGAAKQLQVEGGAVTDFVGTAAALTAGAVTIANTNIAAADKIMLSRQSINGSTALGVLTYAITAATSFTITSVLMATPATTETNDVSIIDYFIVRML